jgi:pimeloyl-ACP methyl ester carboxylesterase
VNTRRILAASLTGLSLIAACATPSEKFEHQADALDLTRESVSGTHFEHTIYLRGIPGASELLHVYLEGDTSPRMAHRYSPPDPTPHQPVMLALMALDPSPSLLLGRPCQHGLEPACSPAIWTVERYGERVVSSLVAALQRQRQALEAEGVVLMGYSGGGALAMLMAERVPQTRAVITLAGNLDTEAWAKHHGYFSLSRSLDPADRPPLDPSIVQIHLLAGQDERVPPVLTGSVIARQPGAATHLYDDFDHSCCWASIWPAVLAELAIGLEARLEQ